MLLLLFSHHFFSDHVPETGGPPTFALTGSAGTGPFVVAAVDPDAPTPVNPTEAQIRHFLGGNFTAGADGALTNSTPAISEFLQPNPPLTSTAHRYVGNTNLCAVADDNEWF